MTLTRRRFLTISAAAALGAGPAGASVQRWTGQAFGAEISLALHGPDHLTRPALHHALRLVRDVERQFSLFDESSVLSALNRAGRLQNPPAMFVQLLQAADEINHATNGLFDPTVQPLWRTLATGGDVASATKLIGWQHVQFDTETVHLGAGQALTFNGIAQGFATDLVTEALHASGLEKTLVNIGEYRGVGGPWKLGLEDPVAGYLGTRTLHSGAIATSSPAAMTLSGERHILHPTARTQWSTVSVEAASATRADGASTALTLAPLAQVRAVKKALDLGRVTLVSHAGDVTTV